MRNRRLIDFGTYLPLAPMQLQFHDKAVALKSALQINPQRHQVGRFVRPHPAPIEAERRAEFSTLFACQVALRRINHFAASVAVDVERQRSVAYKFPVHGQARLDVAADFGRFARRKGGGVFKRVG